MNKTIIFMVSAFILDLSCQSSALAFGDKKNKSNLETPTSRPYENVPPKTDKKKYPTDSEKLQHKTKKSVSDNLNKGR